VFGKAAATFEGKYRFEGFSDYPAPREEGDSAILRVNLLVHGSPAAYTTATGSWYLGFDRLRSVVSVGDREGQTLSRIGYDAFGCLAVGRKEADSPWAFIGKTYDAATGTFDFGFRDYAPRDGRFTSVDPIRDGTNWYSYCASDPVNYWDVLGLEQAGYGPNPRVMQNDLRPEKPQGPCNFRSLVAIVEEESGENFSLREIQNIAAKLNSAGILDINKDYWVYNPIEVVKEAAIAAGFPAAQVEIGAKGIESAKGAQYTIRYINEHIQLGTSDGKLLWEPYRFLNKEFQDKYAGEAEMVRNVWIRLNKDKVK